MSEVRLFPRGSHLAVRAAAGCCGLVGIIRKLIVMKRLHRAVYSAVHMARGYVIFSSNIYYL